MRFAPRGREGRAGRLVPLLRVPVVVFEPRAIGPAVLAAPAHGVDVHHLVHAHLVGEGAHVQDGFVEAVTDGGIIAHGLGLARLLEGHVVLAVQGLALALHLGDPLVEAVLAEPVELEVHPREARAAVIGREAVIGARLVDDGVELRLHAGHRVDLAGQRGDEERVHHAGRGDLEGDRHVHRRGELVDGGDALLGVEEQPLPIEGDHLDREGLGARRNGAAVGDPADRPVGIEDVGADPGQRAERDDDGQGGGPDHHLELGRMVPVGIVGGLLVRGAVAPGEQGGQSDHRHDDEQHQPGRGEDEIALLHRDVAGRLHQHHVAAREEATEEERQGAEHQAAREAREHPISRRHPGMSPLVGRNRWRCRTQMDVFVRCNNPADRFADGVSRDVTAGRARASV